VQFKRSVQGRTGFARGFWVQLRGCGPNLAA
jgi:hypothetical protein